MLHSLNEHVTTFDSESGGRLLLTGQTGIRAECWPLFFILHLKAWLFDMCACVYNCVVPLKHRNPVVSLQIADGCTEMPGDNQALIILYCKVLSRGLVFRTAGKADVLKDTKTGSHLISILGER